MIGWQLRLLIFFRLLDDPRGTSAFEEISREPGLYQSRYANALKGWGFFSLSLIVLVFVFFWVAFSLHLDILPSVTSMTKNWFGRSGAVLVLAAAWVEWEAMRLNWCPGGLMGVWKFESPRMRYFVRKTRLFMLFLLVVGTLIWAYGDTWIR